MGVLKYKDPVTGEIKKIKTTYIEKVHVGADEPTDPNCMVWIKEVDEADDEYMPSKGEVETMIREAVAVYDADGDGIVDDSAKLGGKSADSYIQSNPALNINPDFRINQRDGYYAPVGTTYYSDSACTQVVDTLSIPLNVQYVNSTYCYYKNGNTYVKTSDCKKGYVGEGVYIDMWKSSNTYGQLTKYDGYISISGNGGACTLSQYFENANEFYGKTLTLSIKLKDEDVRSTTITAPTSVPTEKAVSSTINFTNGTSSIRFELNGKMRVVISANDGQTVDIEWVKLELGNVATPLSPLKPSEALSECQRYLYKSSENKPIIGYPIKYNASQIWFSVPIPTSMKNGTTTFLGTLNTDYAVYKSTGEKVEFTTIGAYQHSANSVIILAYLASHGLTTNCYLQFGNNSGISCEL